MNSSNWICFLYESASIFTGIAAKIVKLKDFVSKRNDTINKVLFYGSGDEDQKQQVGLNNLFYIYYVIVHASQTIDVCMPTLESETISKLLINVHQRKKTKVRIIVHNTDSMKYMQSFLDCGIEIKLIHSEDKLEHEFLLIDANCKDALAILGSLDYEMSRVNCNRDSTILTSEEALTTVLKREFERVWTCNTNVRKLGVNDKREEKRSKKNRITMSI